MSKIARYEEYQSPFSARYSSPEMLRLFSEQFRISTYRKLWVSLAKGQKKLGLPITNEQIDELEKNIDQINFEKACEYEKKFRHDVMAHIHAYGDQCPKAKPIIHLGATSSYLTDNTDLIQIKKALHLLSQKLIHLIQLLSSFVENEASSVCLSYTHFQPAQPTTIGKRATLWLQDFLLDATEWDRIVVSLPFFGVKGATGTQASFLALFEGNEEKTKELETYIAHDFGFSKVIPISGQTYSRKIDLHIHNALESFAASAHKMATDIRLLAHEGELVESFGESQVGSSAMPYKRNPIYAERICGISRFVISLTQNSAYTTATQWLERSLDDSSNRRLSIPEAFLGTDAILNLLVHLLSNLKVDQKLALKNLETHILHMCMENILMLAVKKGGDRQEVHEILRKIAAEKKGLAHQLNEISNALHLAPNEIKPLLKPEALIGRAKNQVHDFLNDEVYPFLSRQKKDPVSVSPIEL